MSADPPGVVVRAERTDDHDTVRDVVAAAFGPDEGVHRLLDELRSSVAWLDLSFVAEERPGAGDRAPEVVGHVSYTRAWVDAPRRVVEVLVLSPLSVRPDRQGRGIGSALVRQSLAALTDRPEPLVFLEGDPGYYGRLGFVAAGRWGFTPPSVRIPEQAFQAVRLPAYDATPAADLTGALVYPDVFWRCDAVGLRP